MYLQKIRGTAESLYIMAKGLLQIAIMRISDKTQLVTTITFKFINKYR